MKKENNKKPAASFASRRARQNALSAFVGKTLPIIAICATLLIVIPIITNAAVLELKSPLQCDGKDCTVMDIINKIIDFLIWVGAGIAIIMLVWSAILYITSGANEEKVTKARKNLMWTLIGLAILLAARGIIEVIQETLGQVTK